MDWTALAVSIVTGVLGLTAVSTFMNKYMPNINKWVTLAKDAVETLSDLSNDLSTGALTQTQITKLQADVAQFKTDLAVALGK